MLQLLELSIVKLLLNFYELRFATYGVLWGVFFLLGPGLGLLLLQFFKVGRTITPGLLSMPFLALGYFYSREDEARMVIGQLNNFVQLLSTARPDALPFWPSIFEPLFHVFVAPYQHRFLWEEALFLTLIGYVASVGYHSYGEYKKTGVIFGDVSVARLLKPKQVRPNRSKTNELGSGDLADTEQIARWTKPTSSPELDTSLHCSDLRGSQGIAFPSAKLVIPYEERNRHILIVAKTGSGKTTKMILPVLYNDCMSRSRSTIVIDSKPEMWDKLAGMTAKYNPEKKILLFNPLDLARTLSWNILGKVEDDTDCKLIANTIVQATDSPTAKSDSPFFRNNALAILNAVMVGLLADQKEKKDILSMPRVHQLVQSGMKNLGDWLEAHPDAIRTTRTFVELARSGSQNADTIMSELSMRISAWDLPAIRATTANPEIDLEDLIERPTLFIVEFRESELEMLRPMANVIVVELLRFLTKRAERCPNVTLPRPVSLVIDEFASALGRLPDIHVKLNTLRSRNVSIVAAIQSTGQVKANYKDDADSVLAGFSTKIFMPALDLTDAEWASKETGQMTIRFLTKSAGSNKKLVEFFASRNDGTQEQVQQRAVLTPDEIGRPADNICTFFMPNTPVFQGHMTPFYKIPEMAKRLGEFRGDDNLKLRSEIIKYEERPLEMVAGGEGSGPATVNGLPPGITNTKGWGEDKILSKLEETKKKLDWENTTGSARKWWEAFETENKHRVALVLRLAEELANRKATITEFFLAYVYSNTDNIQANLHYLDYTRLKKEEERKRKEAAAAAAKATAPTATGTATPDGQAAA